MPSPHISQGDLILEIWCQKLEERSRLRGGFSSGEGCDGASGHFWTKLSICV